MKNDKTYRQQYTIWYMAFDDCKGVKDNLLVGHIRFPLVKQKLQLLLLHEGEEEDDDDDEEEDDGKGSLEARNRFAVDLLAIFC